jgi:hypothetical protein
VRLFLSCTLWIAVVAIGAPSFGILVLALVATVTFLFCPELFVFTGEIYPWELLSSVDISTTLFSIRSSS